jgi:predicted RNA binding protein YcfA (HicA-like mRNA interferase family)
MNGYFNQVVVKLLEHGFSKVVGGKGSHEKWRKGSTTTLVPFNCYSRHTANCVMKQAGIDHKF